MRVTGQRANIARGEGGREGGAGRRAAPPSRVLLPPAGVPNTLPAGDLPASTEWTQATDACAGGVQVTEACAGEQATDA